MKAHRGDRVTPEDWARTEQMLAAHNQMMADHERWLADHERSVQSRNRFREAHEQWLREHEQNLRDLEWSRKEHERWMQAHQRKMERLDARIKHAIRLAVREACAEREKRRELDEKLMQLAASHILTEEGLRNLQVKMDAFFDRMGRGGNGYPPA